MQHQNAQGRFIGITIEAFLRPCEIYPIRVACGNGYVWEWSAVEGTVKATHTFDLFFECLDDARVHGYEPHFIDTDQTTDISVVPVTAPS